MTVLQCDIVTDSADTVSDPGNLNADAGQTTWTVDSDTYNAA